MDVHLQILLDQQRFSRQVSQDLHDKIVDHIWPICKSCEERRHCWVNLSEFERLVLVPDNPDLEECINYKGEEKYGIFQARRK